MRWIAGFQCANTALERFGVKSAPVRKAQLIPLTNEVGEKKYGEQTTPATKPAQTDLFATPHLLNKKW